MICFDRLLFSFLVNRHRDRGLTKHSTIGNVKFALCIFSLYKFHPFYICVVVRHILKTIVLWCIAVQLGCRFPFLQWDRFLFRPATFLCMKIRFPMLRHLQRTVKFSACDPKLNPVFSRIGHELNRFSTILYIGWSNGDPFFSCPSLDLETSQCLVFQTKLH